MLRLTLVPAVSLILCIDNWGNPISTVLSPCVLMAGPMVLPQDPSFLTSNSCRGTSAMSATRLMMKVVDAFEVYRWFALVLMITPWLICGR